MCSLCIEIVLVYIIYISSLVESMTKAWAHLAYLGNDPRKYSIGGNAGNLYKQIIDGGSSVHPLSILMDSKYTCDC